MSELNATTAQEIARNEKDCDYMDELFGGVKMPPTQVYIKSEADAVIADLEESHKKDVEQLLMEIAELQKQVHDYAQGLYVIQAKTEKEDRHNKYKRCLAMAKWCEFRIRYYNLLINIEASYLLSNSHNVHKYERKEFRSKYWRTKWLELAEKFKEAK